MQSQQQPFFVLQSKGDFHKLFPELSPLWLEEKQIEYLARKMVEGSFWDDSSQITNGIAIFSQFLAHDITFESTSKLRSFHKPDFFVNDRTPTLDLDCVYGQFTQDFYYDKENRNKLLLGEEYHDDKLGVSWHDLQRNKQHRAIIPDARNDENIIVSRLQVLFIEFHNKIVDLIGQTAAYKDQADKKDSIFQEARKEVIWHYQWLIVHEYLRKVVPYPIWDKAYRGRFDFVDIRLGLPLEFTGAVFRLGHSQTREKNRINAHTEKNLFELGSFTKMDDYVDYRYIFDMGDEKVQFAKLIDTKLDKAFGSIDFIPDKGNPMMKNLAFLNLMRGRAYGLASGEDIARRMGMVPIDVQETRNMKGTPLWFYILREAEIIGEGQCLGPVGGTILAETFFALLDYDKYSYLNLDPLWIPNQANEEGKFTFADLVRFVYPEMC